MATGERTQMSAITVVVVSPLWNGELAPKDERPNVASHEHAMNGESRQRRISSPGQAVLALGHIRVCQLPLGIGALVRKDLYRNHFAIVFGHDGPHETPREVDRRRWLRSRGSV